MKHCYYLILKTLLFLIDFVRNIFGKDSFLLKHKMKIGIMILTLKGIDTSGQIDITRSMCYKTGPRNRMSYDLSINDKITVKPFNNDFLVKAGYRNNEKLHGIVLSYQMNQHTFGIGPYYRYLTFTDRHFFEHYIEFNYQFMFNESHRNELNITTGFLLFYGGTSLPIRVDLACQYTYTYGSGDNHLFRPVVGVHYYFRAKVKKPQTSD